MIFPHCEANKKFFDYNVIKSMKFLDIKIIAKVPSKSNLHFRIKVSEHKY